ncbi:hypothetical protein EDC04DRAFT_2870858 [Pisolithus marmoratus]|nr:hypothetical protein EDC04DRAFT_2870858 [Pisolithus marmoratus]
MHQCWQKGEWGGHTGIYLSFIQRVGVELPYLVEHRPAYFQGFKDMVGELEFVEAILVVKTPIIAAHTMECVNSPVPGNIQSITGLLSQAGIHNPKDKDNLDMLDISNYVMLFHGDLGTAEHVHVILQHRAVEDSPWNQCQYGISQRLDCWQSEVANLNPRLKSLEAFADMRLTFTQVKDIVTMIAHKYVATNALERVHWKPSSQCDMQLENALIINKYMPLYEELTHAMNVSDIMRVELCIIAWILIFKATGKHKYAAYMMEFLLNIHFLYPVGLQ